MLLKLELKQLDGQVHYFFRGGWVGGVEEWRIKPSQLSTKLKLKLKVSLTMVQTSEELYLSTKQKVYSTIKRMVAIYCQTVLYGL